MALLQTVTSGQYVPPSTITVMAREYVQNVVTIIDPFSTPIVDLMGDDGEAQSTIHQWGVDNLPNLVLNNTTGSISVDGVNVQGLVEGFEFATAGTGNYTFSDSMPYTGQPQRLTNYVQIYGAKVGVNDSLKRMRTIVGIGDPYVHEQMKASKVIDKAFERRLFDNASANASFTSGSASDPRRMKALFEWASGTPALNQATQGGTLGVDTIDAAMEAAITAGGQPTILAVSWGVKFDLSVQLRQNVGSSISGASGPINQSWVQGQEQKVTRSVDLYWSDGGPIQIIASRNIPQSSATTGGGKAWLLEIDRLKKVTYVPLVHIPLAKTGYNTKGILVTERTYAFRHPGGSAVINNVTT